MVEVVVVVDSFFWGIKVVGLAASGAGLTTSGVGSAALVVGAAFFWPGETQRVVVASTSWVTYSVSVTHSTSVTMARLSW